MARDLRAYLRVLWKRKWYASAAFVITVGVAAALTFTAAPVYVARTSLFVGQQQISVKNLTEGLAVTDLSARLLKSYAAIVTSKTIAQRAVLDAGLSIPADALVGGLLVSPITDTQVIEVGYKSSDPQTAAQVVNAVANAFVRQIREIDSPGAGNASPAVTVSVIDRADTPQAPVSPVPARNLSLGFVVGLALAAGVAMGVEKFDTSVKSREEAEELGLPVVGVIPRLDTHGADVYLDRDPQDLGGEAFRKLRTAIGYLGVEKPIQTLLVTSSIPQEGKTTVALNLAAAYAWAGYNTALVEADLRRPTLHRIFGVSGTDGLTTVIIGDANLATSLRSNEVAGLRCLTAGAIPPNPVELLESEQMARVLASLKSEFDMIVIDSPPVMPVADALALAARCDGVIAVVRAGKTDRDRLMEAVKQIERSSGRFLGLVVNFLRPGDSVYEYGYYGSYRSARAAEQTSRADL